MSYRDRDFDRGRGSTVDWGDQDNGYRGQSSRRDRFGGWNDAGQDFYGDQGFRG
jgi:hypothetical protein